MLKKLYQILLILIITNTVQAQTATTVYTDPAKAIIVSQKEPQFTITLASNPTTGYSWFLRKYNTQFVKVVNHVYHPPISQIAGAGGKEQWTFALNPAAFTAPHLLKINLLYARPWNLQDNSKSVVFTVYSNK